MALPCGQVDHARRMPLAPWLFAVVAWAGGGVWAAVLARLMLLLGVLVAVLGLDMSSTSAPGTPAALAPDKRSAVSSPGTSDIPAALDARAERPWWRSRCWTLVLALLAASPLFAKHLGELGYEEGFSLVLVPASMVVGLGVVDMRGPARSETRAGRDVMFGVLLGAVFLVKSAYLLLWGVGALALVWVALRQRRRSAWLGLLLALSAPIGWMVFVQGATGRVSLGTSWDGENLFRGWCAECSRVYPWQSLDRLFDSELITTSLESVRAPYAPPRCSFAGEWAWSDHYRDRALAWALRAPGEALVYLLRKAWVVLVEVRPVPLIGGLDVARALVVVGSTLVLRCAALVALVLAWRERARLAGLAPLVVFGLAGCAALCAPLLVAFAYDRHSVVVLVAFLFVAAGIARRAWRADPIADDLGPGRAVVGKHASRLRRAVSSLEQIGAGR